MIKLDQGSLGQQLYDSKSADTSRKSMHRDSRKANKLALSRQKRGMRYRHQNWTRVIIKIFDKRETGKRQKWCSLPKELEEEAAQGSGGETYILLFHVWSKLWHPFSFEDTWNTSKLVEILDNQCQMQCIDDERVSDVDSVKWVVIRLYLANLNVAWVSYFNRKKGLGYVDWLGYILLRYIYRYFVSANFKFAALQSTFFTSREIVGCERYYSSPKFTRAFSPKNLDSLTTGSALCGGLRYQPVSDFEKDCSNNLLNPVTTMRAYILLRQPPWRPASVSRSHSITSRFSQGARCEQSQVLDHPSEQDRRNCIRERV